MNGSPDQAQSVAVTCPGCFHPRTWEAAAACPICHHRVHAQGRSSTLLLVGTQLKNYIVGEKLGQGGFGITYRGFDLNLHMKVAIKEYYPSEWVGRSTDQKTVVLNASEHEDLFQYCRKTFVREARTIAQVRHPHVVRVLSYFELNGTAYLVMDYYEGQDLSRFLKPAAGQPGVQMPWRQAVALLLPVLDGLHKVHQIGFMHRDIKPGNLYLSEDGLILLDFGSARQVVSSHTQSKLIFTEGYAPYEQYSEGQLDRQGPWTDVYAVAATLYFMLTTRRPSSALDRIQAALTQKPDTLKPARQFVADVPPGLDQALGWALAVEPERRPQSVVEFKRELENLLVAHPEPKPQPLPVKADIAPELPTRSVPEGRISPSRAAKAEPEIESNRASEPPPAPHPTTPALRATPPSTSAGSPEPKRKKSRSPSGIALISIIALIGLLAWGGWSIGLKPTLERRSTESPTTPPVVASSSPSAPPALRLDRSYLTVVTTPATAQVRIMNISPPYWAGIGLMPGDFDIQVTAPDYQTYRGWHTLAAGVINLPIGLQKKEAPLPVSPPPTAEDIARQKEFDLQLAVVKKLLEGRKILAARRALEDMKTSDREGRAKAFRREQTATMQATALAFLDQGQRNLAKRVMDDLGQWDPQSAEYRALRTRLNLGQ